MYFVQNNPRPRLNEFETNVSVNSLKGTQNRQDQQVGKAARNKKKNFSTVTAEVE